MLKQIIDLISSGFFSHDEPGLFQPILDSLLQGGDRYLVFADFDSYIDCQNRATAAYRDTTAWTRMSISNAAKIGRFSSDRTISQYADEIWGAQPVQVNLNSK